MPAKTSHELIPSASRLIYSLRDLGYEFTSAIADLVDESIEAGRSDDSMIAANPHSLV